MHTQYEDHGWGPQPKEPRLESPLTAWLPLQPVSGPARHRPQASLCSRLADTTSRCCLFPGAGWAWGRGPGHQRSTAGRRGRAPRALPAGSTFPQRLRGLRGHGVIMAPSPSLPVGANRNTNALEHRHAVKHTCAWEHTHTGTHAGASVHRREHTPVLLHTHARAHRRALVHTHTGRGRGGAVGWVCAHPRWITQPCPWGLRPLQFEPTPAAVWAWSQQGTAGWPTAESGPVVQGLEGSHLAVRGLQIPRAPRWVGDLWPSQQRVVPLSPEPDSPCWHMGPM